MRVILALLLGSIVAMGIMGCGGGGDAPAGGPGADAPVEGDPTGVEMPALPPTPDDVDVPGANQ